MIDRTEYAPYGSIVATAATQNIGNNYKFTGKEADSENNLQYFGARYYDNRVGKFTAIDPYSFRLDKIQNLLFNPQYLNGYSYSLNNPVVLVDPNGNLPIVIGLIWLAANPEAVILTAATAYSLYTAVKDWGQGVGYAIEGDTQTSQQYLNQSILDQSVALFSGAASLEVMPRTVQQSPSTSVSNTNTTRSSQSASQTLTQKANSAQQPQSSQPTISVRSAELNQLSGSKVNGVEIPSTWNVRPSRGSGGVIYEDPANPQNNNIRLMPGNPNSPYASQQQPYMRVMRNGQYRDINNNIVTKNAESGHIPITTITPKK